MNSRTIQSGKNVLISGQKTVDGSFVDIEGEKFFKISNYDQMPDFFMSIVSDSDHFMFISSNGSLTAGRKNKNNALFPYYTDDKIHDYRDRTGSKTYLLVTRGDGTFLWEPFTKEAAHTYPIERNIYKSIYGNKLIFEEINTSLGLGFRYGWYNSSKFGFIKKSGIRNLENQPVRIEVLDGFKNILPAGVDYAFQNEYSNLLDAYKKNELVQPTTLAVYSLSSIPVDRPEPSEALKATTVWSAGAADGAAILLSDRQVQQFISGEGVRPETDVRASRGAYFMQNTYDLNAMEEKTWFFAAEVNQDSKDVANLLLELKNNTRIGDTVNEDIRQGTIKLKQIIGTTDGFQVSNEDLSATRHMSNTLYNVMRGGVFLNGYQVDTNDFIKYVYQTSTALSKKFNAWLANLPGTILYSTLVEHARQQEDPDLLRIAREYFPLTFSRRHGDPSRPWNNFSIENKHPDGSLKLHYEGNWRDIFQNWEALSLSFPEYLEGMIGKFVNASTADGYNPYRITREGIDWEVQDPEDPWAFIGYWGDHQIIYLQKFLEHTEAFFPGRINEFLTSDAFVYAHVPYEIKPFEQITSDPKDTIEFNHALHDKLTKRAKEQGADGKLLRDSEGSVVHANFSEKILVTLLAKLSNFIPEAGIWLNTQRPEWNDANNALVGNGTSMVTLYYIRRFLTFWKNLLHTTGHNELTIATEIATHFQETFEAFRAYHDKLDRTFTDEERYGLTALLGTAGSKYRQTIYANSFSGKKTSLSVSELNAFISLALRFVDHSIHRNKRSDNLYHAYNLVSFKDGKITIRHLYEMLEGQVAVLSAGILTPEESLTLMDALKASKLFREDQYSYILYPDRELTRFTDKNNIPARKIPESALLKKFLQRNQTDIVTKDDQGNLHFNAAFRNGAMLSEALENLDKSVYGDLLTREKQLLLDMYEAMFDHQSFTGRSGTFYGYEGLGSIYWHMVSKLLLAVQESFFDAVRREASISVISKIAEHYYEIKAGIGLYKKPDLYGAFPTDAYSHTPGNAGVKQPGLTGQVKEDVISRFGELGLTIEKGQIVFNTTLLNRNELLRDEKTFQILNLEGAFETVTLEKNQLGFTFCQVPVIYNSAEKEYIVVHTAHEGTQRIEGNQIPEKTSKSIFDRDATVKRIDYYSPALKIS
jgi:hypothetical protein